MQLSPVRQAELHSDIKIQEKNELQWKKVKVEGLDENGEKEAQLRRNFNGETALSWTAVTLYPGFTVVSHLCAKVLWLLSIDYAFNIGSDRINIDRVQQEHGINMKQLLSWTKLYYESLFETLNLFCECFINGLLMHILVLLFITVTQTA